MVFQFHEKNRDLIIKDFIIAKKLETAKKVVPKTGSLEFLNHNIVCGSAGWEFNVNHYIQIRIKYTSHIVELFKVPRDSKIG